MRGFNIFSKVLFPLRRDLIIADRSSGKQAQLSSDLPASTPNVVQVAPGSTSGHNSAEPAGFLRDERATADSVNVILCGEMGVGKSALVNLIAQREVAQVSSDVQRCTMQTTCYSITIDNTRFSIFDTAGLGASPDGSNDYITALEKAYKLVVALSNAGGVHLVLYAISGGRIRGVPQNYKLFVEVVCQAKVSVALVFTGLENEEMMDDWWTRNNIAIAQLGIKSDDHACVTTVEDRPEKYVESQKKMRELLKRCTKDKAAFLPEPDSWFVHLGAGMQPFATKNQNAKRKDVIRALKEHCNLEKEMAERLASMLK